MYTDSKEMNTLFDFILSCYTALKQTKSCFLVRWYSKHLAGFREVQINDVLDINEVIIGLYYETLDGTIPKEQLKETYADTGNYLLISTKAYHKINEMNLLYTYMNMVRVYSLEIE